MNSDHQPKISIITVCHKSSIKIREYVSSFIKNHNHVGDKSFCEFIFIENSQDKNIEKAVSPLADYGFKASIIHCENNGFGAGCNIGASKANGEILAFVNPDMRFLSDILPLLEAENWNGWGTVKQLANNKRISSIDWLPEKKGLIFEVLKGYIWINLLDRFFLRNSYASGSFLIVDKNLFFQAGRFNEEFFMYYEEAELCRRLYIGSGKLYIEKRVIVSHEGFGSQTSRAEVLRNEAKGLITYCKVTNQENLLQKKLRLYKTLGIWSKFNRTKFHALRDSISVIK
ncbi:glycosyltransferase [Pseudomonas sp. TCU-HL1]|uniref:glycosyltransferase n=1 Tax=Pseudomonas sp. TCU-HL1 TaxID=1856685 RepID=UPI0008575786|nr:glycosyltransferase [Pseudomonas sp. TCU-HL1]AOE83155.1 hypothetical protein THL1_607 [Pseudomonas sp. TCU-HL1]